MIKKAAFVILFLVMCVPCYGIRLPNIGEYKQLSEYVEDTQESDIASALDHKRTRKGSRDKRPWTEEALLGMETEVPPSQNCGDPIYRLANPEECDPVKCDDPLYAITHVEECGAENCEDIVYAISHPEECDPAGDDCEDPYYALDHPDECLPSGDMCDDQYYAISHPEECDNSIWPPVSPTPACNDPWYRYLNPGACPSSSEEECKPSDWGDSIAYAIRSDVGGVCIDEDSWECGSMSVIFYNCSGVAVSGPEACGVGASCTGSGCRCGSSTDFCAPNPCPPCSGGSCYEDACLTRECEIDGTTYDDGTNDLRSSAMRTSGCCYLP